VFTWGWREKRGGRDRDEMGMGDGGPVRKKES